MEKFWDHLEANNLYSHLLFGVRSIRCAVEQPFLNYSDVEKLVDEIKVVDIAYSDFSKEYDLVCHDILLEKLLAHGFDSYLISWVSVFLKSRLMNVSVEGKLSRGKEILPRVTQGSVQALLLFQIYVYFIISNVLGSWAALLTISNLVCDFQGII